MHDRKTLAKLNERAVELHKLNKFREAVQAANKHNGDIWPGDRPDFDGSVRYEDASPEYAGSRASKRLLCVGYGRDGVIEIRS